MKDAILFGNGFNLVGGNHYSWTELLSELGNDTGILSELPLTMQYEHIYLNTKRQYKDSDDKPRETRLKEAIVRKINDFKSNAFYRRLRELEVADYLTTNYDEAFYKDGFQSVSYVNSEKVYSIRRWSRLTADDNSVKFLFHVHGNMKTIASLTIGFDQYIGSSRRVDQWVKGEYAKEVSIKGERKNKDYVPSMYSRLSGTQMAGDYGFVSTESGLYSWIDAFFMRNLHSIGFGLDFARPIFGGYW